MRDVSPVVSPARKRMLDAAVEAFSELGYGGTSTRDIAARAGRSPAAVYVHHDSKEDLLFEASLRGHQEVLEVMRAAYAEHEGAPARLWAMIHDFSAWHVKHARLARVVQYELRSLTDDHLAEVVPLRAECERLVRSTLTQGVRTGEFEVGDISATADALLSLGIDLARRFARSAQGGNKAPRVNADLALHAVRR